MKKERLEYLLNTMYYEYLETNEAQEVIDYVKRIEEENEHLKLIIKEVREYIENNFDKCGICVSGTDMPYSYIEELLEILDKVGDNK